MLRELIIAQRNGSAGGEVGSRSGSHNMGYANLRGGQCYNPTILPRGSTLCSNPNPPPNGAVILGGAG